MSRLPLGHGDTAQQRSRLAGIRLGERERYVLRSASRPEILEGWPIDGGPNRAAHEALMRAARKLERIGLLETEKVPVVGRAEDPRRGRLLYRDGQFWKRLDRTRRQVVYRRRAWRSPFGQEILEAYLHELHATGFSVRWDERAAAAEQRAVRQPSGYVIREELRLRARPTRASWPKPYRSELQQPDSDGPLYPDFVTEESRWDACAFLAGEERPSQRPEALWDVACEMYRSQVPTTDLVRRWFAADAASDPMKRR